jgi:dihydroorotate dehydrogenase
MNIIRRIVEEGYLLSKPIIFNLTKEDPESAHENIIKYSNLLHEKGLDKFFFNHSDNAKYSKLKIANGGGFNKNGDIPPIFLKYLGFDRVVVGTVTNDPWEGNPRPRIVRYPETESLVNWQGLPGKGSKEIADNLWRFWEDGYSRIPLTINVMSTPGKKGNSLIKDLEGSVIDTRDIPYVNRYQINISCPNTRSSEGELDARKEYFKQMPDMIRAVKEMSASSQEIEVKFSPDMSNEEIIYALTVLEDEDIKRIVVGNTTTFHDSRYINPSPGKGGASGDAVYYSSLKTQKMFQKFIKQTKMDMHITACGGISSPERLREKIETGADEIEIYTPLIFKGPKLIRELRKEFERMN